MKNRNIAVCIILSIITCGIYSIYWFVKLNDDVVTVSSGKEYQTSGGAAFLFSLLTCGIYSIYWSYKMGKSLYVTKLEKNMPASDESILYLILSILGLGIINYCLIQSELNKLNNSANI